MYVPDPNNGQESGKQWQHLLNSYAPASGPQNSCLGVSQIDCMAGTWNAQQHVQGTITLHVPLPDDSGVLCSGRLSIGIGPGDIGIGVGGCAGGGDGGSIQVTWPINTTASSIIEGCLTPLCAGDPADEGDRPAEGGCSFTARTEVATDHGEQEIGKLHAGEKVWAYNSQTHQMELQPILHVWIHPDNDLVDLTITAPAHQKHGKVVPAISEVVHTNKKHPFLTVEKGFLPVGKITVGMHVVRADGSIGEITGWKVVPGSKRMYNLEVAQDHTFTVGEGQWVVHNCAVPADGVPSDVQEMATRTDQVREDQNLGPRWTPENHTPNVVSANIDITSDDLLLHRISEDFVSNGDNAHAEELAIQWGERELPGLTDMFGQEVEYRLKMVTQYRPCADQLCQLKLFWGVWESRLDAAAGLSVNLEIWHYPDEGDPYLYFKI
ncbi:MAG TPA: polymorphic toxin-type HINT domain-containing protein [Ktedonobacteraceae bacterium]|nr:polymorphic toxin-type HINT domain-containing protein [Ktedonobacteraceae bacterium]